MKRPPLTRTTNEVEVGLVIVDGKFTRPTEASVGMYGQS